MIETMICQECDRSFVGEVKRNGVRKEFSWHLKKVHQTSLRDYIVKFKFDGIHPTCVIEGCCSLTRFTSSTSSFKKFCKEHSREGAAHAGRQRKGKPSWCRGLTKNDHTTILRRSREIVGSGNPFFGKKHTDSSLEKMRKKRRISRERYERRTAIDPDHYDILTPYEEYETRQQLLRVLCKKCDREFFKSLENIDRGLLCCPLCAPVGSSIPEREMADVVEEMGLKVIRNCRSILSGKELDVYVPEKKVAFEYNGIYWHSDASPRGIRKDHHYEKSRLCAEKGIILIQFFSDEWRDKREICESMIRHKLGASPFRAMARDCLVSSVDRDSASAFFDENHISGHVPSKVNFGLRDAHGRLVSLLSLRSPRQKKYRDMDLIEVARFCCLKNTSVVGGLSKLVSHVCDWSRKNGRKGIMTYVDLRFGDMGGYEKSGFEFVRHTGLNFWYSDGDARHDRFKFRANKAFGMSEKQVADSSGVYRVYGCGSNIYVKIF